MQRLCNHRSIAFSKVPTFCIPVRLEFPSWNRRTVALENTMTQSAEENRVVEALRRLAVARIQDFASKGITRKSVAHALADGLIERAERGTYVLPGFFR